MRGTLPREHRVNTTRQVTRDTDTDETLPVQREAIRAFVRARPDGAWPWNGVSAYRHASSDRDVLQDVLRAAARQEFDILLVFSGSPLVGFPDRSRQSRKVDSGTWARRQRSATEMSARKEARINSCLGSTLMLMMR